MIFGVDEAFVVETWGSEVDEESAYETCGFEVVEDLGGLDVAEDLDRFEFDDDGTVADEVGSIGCAQHFAFYSEPESDARG